MRIDKICSNCLCPTVDVFPPEWVYKSRFLATVTLTVTIIPTFLRRIGLAVATKARILTELNESWYSCAPNAVQLLCTWKGVCNHFFVSIDVCHVEEHILCMVTVVDFLHYNKVFRTVLMKLIGATKVTLISALMIIQPLLQIANCCICWTLPMPGPKKVTLPRNVTL